jgi:hypothetical protein
VASRPKQSWLVQANFSRVRPALAGAGLALAGLTSAAFFLFLRRFQASSLWFFFFLLFHASMMLDLNVDVVDAHDTVVSERHPVSSPLASKRVVLDFYSTSSCRGGRYMHLYLVFAM